MVALRDIAPQVDEPIELLLRLDALGDGHQAQAVGQSDDGAHDRVGVGAGPEAGDEAPIDLDAVDREALEVGQRRVPRPEVVDVQAQAQRPELGEHRPAGCHVGHEHTLGDLQRDGRRVGPATLECTSHERHQTGVDQLAGREVDRDGRARSPGGSVGPATGLRARLLEDVGADGHDEAVLLGERDEVERRHDAVVWAVPSHERLDTVDLARRKAHRRLVDDVELRPLHRAVQGARGREALHGPVAHGPVEQLEAVAAPVLGAVHRRVGVLDERLRRLRASSAEGDADAGGREQLALPERERLLEGRSHAVDDAQRVRLVLHLLAQHRELVAAEARDGVARTHSCPEPGPDGAQQGVAGAVAEAVVDDLEPVEVEEQHQRPPVTALGAAQRPREPVEERVPVGQVGERVVVGLVREPPLHEHVVDRQPADPGGAGG